MAIEPGIEKLRIELLRPDQHDRASFSCGVDRLDNYLKRNAREQHARDFVRTYVVIAQGDPRVLGYFVLNTGELDASALAAKPKGTPAHGHIPVVFLSRIAVDRVCQGQGIGRILLLHAFLKTDAVAAQVGCHGLMLDVMNDGDEAAIGRRRRWYESFGFVSFPSDPAKMFVPIKTIRALLDSSS